MTPTPDLAIVRIAIRKEEKPDLTGQASVNANQTQAAPPTTVETKGNTDPEPLKVVGQAITLSPRR